MIVHKLHKSRLDPTDIVRDLRDRMSAFWRQIRQLAAKSCQW